MSVKTAILEKTDYENHLDAKTAKWFAVYTRYKREKQVAKRLATRQIEHYLPLQKVVRQYDRKRKTVELPLISCYIFVKIKKDEYVPVLEDLDVVRFVKFSKNLISIPEQEIEIIKRILHTGESTLVENLTYTEGDAVEIRSGSLIGMKGKLIQKKGKHNFLIELQNIHYALRLEIEPNLLRKIE